MSNQVTASILFCFKGTSYSPSLDLDLDRYMHTSGHIPNLYPLIARANNFDLYSYEYEMMQAEPIKFSNPQGMPGNHRAGAAPAIQNHLAGICPPSEHCFQTPDPLRPDPHTQP